MLFKPYLPENQKTMTVYVVEQYWQGKGGSWEHGLLSSVPFANRHDAQKFLDNIIETGEWENGTEDFDKNYETKPPEIKEYYVLMEYVSPGNSRDYKPRSYHFHQCLED